MARLWLFILRRSIFKNIFIRNQFAQNYCSAYVASKAMAESQPDKNSVSNVTETDTTVPEVQTPESPGGNQEMKDKLHTVISKRALKRLRREALRQGKKTRLTLKHDDLQMSENNNLISEASLNETSYYFENGLRKVYPYHFTFNTFAKRRWIGRTILDVFTEEYKSEEPQTYQRYVEAGKIKVNGNIVTKSYKMKDNDFVTSMAHRHEMPVTSQPIEILVDTPEVLVVNKPSSIPMHPCGRFRHNCLIYILAKEHNLHNLRPMYRLDRMTSGLVIICRTAEKARILQDQLKKRLFEKEYICKVDGEFPNETIECNEPLDVLNSSMGLFKVAATGKESKTTFERISTNGKTSLVRCKPHTGRTHQIRVHLQYLGYPIVNDVLYNSPVWGPGRGKGGHFDQTEEELMKGLRKEHQKQIFIGSDHPTQHRDKKDEEQTNQLLEHTDPPHKKPKLEIDSSPDASAPSVSAGSCSHMTSSAPEEVASTFDPSKMTFDPDCTYCHHTYRDPEPDELIMYLHAYKYKGPGWEYSTPLPEWAKEDQS